MHYILCIFWIDVNPYDYWSKEDGKKIGIYCLYKPGGLHPFDFHICLKRTVSLIISLNRWSCKFGKDESFAQVHVTCTWQDWGFNLVEPDSIDWFEIFPLTRWNDGDFKEMSSVCFLDIYGGTPQITALYLKDRVCVHVRVCVGFIYSIRMVRIITFCFYSNQFVWQEL